LNKEFSAGSVVFRKENGRTLFLLVYSKRNKNWGFPKGHLEEGETEIDAGLRETREETGLRELELKDGFKEEITYVAVSNRGASKGQKIEKRVTYFLCGTSEKDINTDDYEIGGHEWLDFTEAEKRLSFISTKEVLRKANDYVIIVQK